VEGEGRYDRKRPGWSLAGKFFLSAYLRLQEKLVLAYAFSLRYSVSLVNSIPPGLSTYIDLYIYPSEG
jgi:hypothetical protein